MMTSSPKDIISCVVALGLGLGLSVPGVQAQSGSLEPPGSAVDGGGDPVATMKTLDQIPPTWSQRLPADDGLANGCGSSRFSCVLGFQLVPSGGGFIQDWNAVLDKETGLVWERSPLTTTHLWSSARTQCVRRGVGGQMGWRLPSIHELTSLVVPGNPAGGPDLPAGHPFSNVQSAFYWSASTSANIPTSAWVVDVGNGGVGTFSKGNGTGHAWCVRGGGPLSEY